MSDIRLEGVTRRYGSVVAADTGVVAPGSRRA